MDKLVIDNYRKFKHLEVNLKQFNLLIGRNNTGKTSFLEAVALASSPTISTIYGINNSRIAYKKQLMNPNYFSEVYMAMFNNSNTFTINRNIVKGAVQNSNIGTDFVCSINNNVEILHGLHQPDRYNDLPLILTQEFKVTNPNYYNVGFDSEDIRLIDSAIAYFMDNNHVLFAPYEEPILIKDNSFSPLYKHGLGVKKFIYLILAVYHSKNDVLLCDEFDLGFSPIIAKELYRVIFKLALKYNVQLFFTEHSLDFIDSFLLEDYLHSIRVIRFHEDRVREFDTERIYRLRNRSGVDVRI